MRDANPSITMLVAFMLLITASSTNFSVQAESDECDEGLACEWVKPDSGSNVVLLQEITAIWCEICAVTDTTIQQFTNQRHEEVARIAYHPDDGTDYLGNRLSTRQMWNLGQNPTEAEFPTLWMDGANKASGPTSENQLHRAYLKAAGQRTSEDSLQIEYYNLGNNGSDQNRLEFIASVSGENTDEIIFVLTENRVEIDNPELYNGVRYHDNVATAGLIVNSNNGSITFAEPNDAWEIINWSQGENNSELRVHYNYSASSTGNGYELLKQKSLVVYTEDMTGKVIAAQQIQSDVGFSDNESNSIIIIAGIALVGLLLATPALQSFNESKIDNNRESGAESEE
jgi:hypothetical protein